MIGVIMEGALFVALIATVAALLFYALVRWTLLGLRPGASQLARDTLSSPGASQTAPVAGSIMARCCSRFREGVQP